MPAGLKDLFSDLEISDRTVLFEDEDLRRRFLSLTKSHCTYHNYYQDKDLRDLLFDLIPYNEDIPWEIRNLLDKSRDANPPRLQFIEEWTNDGIWAAPKTETVDLASFLEFIIDAENITRRFSERNLHNASYFYSKLMEWYLSCREIDLSERRQIADIGSAYFGFGAIAESQTSIEQIYLVDLGYPEGALPLTQKVTQVGANASDLPFLEDGSIDLITLHNAIEHFSHGADAQCLKEIDRLLKPDGKAIISPLFFNSYYAISLNPVSAFFFLEDNGLADFIIDQAKEHDAFVRLSRTMLSPYAHIYDYRTLKRLLLDSNLTLVPTLKKIEVAVPEETASALPGAFGVPFETDTFTKRPFYTLELSKPLTQ